MRATRRAILSTAARAVAAAWLAVAAMSVAAMAATNAAARLADTERATAVPPPHPELYREWVNARIHLQNAQFYHRRYQAGPLVSAAVAAELDRADASLGRIRRGPPVPFVPGVREEGYLAENDGSFQPFMRFVPEHAAADPPMPLVVLLHGYSPYLNIINWTNLPPDLIAFAQSNNVCVVSPFGRSNTDFQSVGEQDVMRAIAEMRDRYPIDPDRIILAGHSMGGMGAWTIAAHYPDVFAGLLIIAGRGDYYFWQKTPRASLPSYKRPLIDAEFARPLLANLAKLPVLCFHGTDDPLIDIAEAEHIMTPLMKINPHAKFVKLEGSSHWIESEVFPRPDTQQWILDRRRITPEEFSYTTHHPRYPLPHWLAATPLGKRVAPVSVSVRRAADKLEIAVTGLQALTVNRGKMPASLRGLPIVAPDGVEVTVTADAVRPAAGLTGPVKEAFLAPFVFVSCYPATDVDGAREFQRRVYEWYRYAKAPPRTATELRCPVEQRKRYNLFLFGEPETSPMIRDVLATTEIQVAADEYVVGAQRYPRAGNGLYFIVANPWNKERYAAVQCGIPWGARLSENHRYDLLPDYIVYSAETDADSSNTALCAGFFDAKWRLDPTTMFLADAPAPAARVREER